MELKVKGMMCTGCEKTIEKALMAIDGIKSVNADHEKGIVKIDADDKLKDKIIEAIKNLDFDV